MYYIVLKVFKFLFSFFQVRIYVIAIFKEYQVSDLQIILIKMIEYLKLLLGKV